MFHIRRGIRSRTRILSCFHRIEGRLEQVQEQPVVEQVLEPGWEQAHLVVQMLVHRVVSVQAKLRVPVEKQVLMLVKKPEEQQLLRLAEK